MSGHPTSFPTTRPGATRRSASIDRWLAVRLAALLATVDVRVQLWDGHVPDGSARHPIGTLLVGDRATLLGLTCHPELWFGEAYAEGRLAVEGELEPVIEALSRLSRPVPLWRDRVRALLAPPITLARARGNARRHYDLGNEFYRLWLDEQMVYTCAYFADPAMSLEDAQRCKLELVCRKLALRPGERVLETGSGWGAMALHMARYHGVSVTAYNVSREQVACARARAAADGLAARVTFVEDDYRAAAGEYDAFVSIGMLEHVGRRQFADFAAVLQRTVKRRGGRGLLHFIGRDSPRPLNAWIRRRIFPDAYPPALHEVAQRILAPARMSVVDVENLRLHYARTLRHWSRRFAAAGAAVRASHGEPFRRAWELYLAGSEAAFVTGWLQLYQVLFVPVESQPPYWTRGETFRAPLVEPCTPVMR